MGYMADQLCNYSDIWQVCQQHYCEDTREFSEQHGHFNTNVPTLRLDEMLQYEKVSYCLVDKHLGSEYHCLAWVYACLVRFY